MSDLIKKIRTDDGDKQIDYEALANKPTIDQTYNSNSQNAQSGVAVKEAIDLTAPRIEIVTSKAKSHTLTDTANRNMLGIKIIGNTSQDGTPSPENPIPIQCVKQGTKIIVKNTTSTACELTLPCDLYDGDIWHPLHGVVERYNRIFTINSTTKIADYELSGTRGIVIGNVLEAPQMRGLGYCNYARVDTTSVGTNPRVWFGVNSRHIYWVGILDYLGLSSVEEFKEWLVGKDVTFIYKEVTPIIEQYEPISNSLLKTFYPVTNLLNDNVTELEADIVVEYSADTKNYIDNNSGGSLTIDQTYNPESSNAQSGKAVAEAIANIEISGGGGSGTNGKDVVSPTVEVTETANGHNVSITDVNGTKSFEVLDGEDGAKGEKGDQGIQGEKGDKGDKGEDGKDGTSVAVSKVTESTADGGSNVVTFSDGKTLTVKNGSKGSKGDPGATGAAGKTPVKGTDYWTEADKAEIVADVVDAMEGIPSYWQTHLDERVEDIRRAMESAGRNKSSFFFYSDAHWDNDGTYTAKLSPSLLKYLYKKTPINKTNYGGDIVNGEGSTDTDNMKYLWAWREQLRDLPKHHSVVGNHDDGNGKMDRKLSKEYVYSYLLAPEESNDIVWGGDFYYYIDDKSEKTRYLYLDIFYDGVSSAQTAFVSEALKSTPTDWHIVAISHAWFGVNYGTTENPIYPPILNGLATEMQPFFDMFDNYNARGGEYGDCGGWVELCIGGHYHLDHYDHTNGGIPVIIVEADTLHNRSGTMPQKGTTDEASVSAVVVDYNSNVVKVIRVGRGESFEVPINRVAPTSYTNVIPLSVDKEGNIFNSGKGWADNSRIGSGGIYLGNGTHYVTGHIEIDPSIDNTIYLKNVTFDGSTHNNYAYVVAFFDESFTKLSLAAYSADIGGNVSLYRTVLDGTNIIQFLLSSHLFTENNATPKYFAICCSYLGDDSIITINEPIE